MGGCLWVWVCQRATEALLIMQSKPQGMLSHDSACNGYAHSDEKLPVEKDPSAMQQCFLLAM